MIQVLYFSVFPVQSGWLGISGTDAGLRRITLPQTTEAHTRQILLNNTTGKVIFKPDCFERLAEKLKTYFRGQKVAFEEKLDFSGATPFQQNVWQAAEKIPYGQTWSYVRIAEEIGKPQASRAVGQALGKNPLPIIVPCHRVISTTGEIGGFTGGVEMKRFLLRLEGISI